MSVGQYCQFGLSVLHAQDEPGRLQVPVPAAVVLKRHKPSEVHLLYVLQHTKVEGFQHATGKNTLLCHTYISILGIIEEVQGIPTQTAPESPECLSGVQTDMQYDVYQG